MALKPCMLPHTAEQTSLGLLECVASGRFQIDQLHISQLISAPRVGKCWKYLETIHHLPAEVQRCCYPRNALVTVLVTKLPVTQFIETIQWSAQANTDDIDDPKISEVDLSILRRGLTGYLTEEELEMLMRKVSSLVSW